VLLGCIQNSPLPAVAGSQSSPSVAFVDPGWEEAESHRAADTATEASWRSHASGSGDGGGFGGDRSWGTGYGDHVEAVEVYSSYNSQ
jgi:hypothetical protein